MARKKAEASTDSSKPDGKKTKKTKTDKKAKTSEGAAAVARSNQIDPQEQALLLNTHIPAYKSTKEKLGTANSNFRNALKAAKAHGFSREDIELAISLQDAEKEAREKARMTRRLVIAKMVGSDLGQQLDMFLDASSTPLAIEERAYQEGKMASAGNQAAKPDYDPGTAAHAAYMRGFHEHQEGMLKNGIAKKEADKAKPEGKAKTKGNGADAEPPKPAAATPPLPSDVTSGVPLSRAQFLAQQAAAKQNAPQPDPEPPPARGAAMAADAEDDEDDEPSAFQRKAS